MRIRTLVPALACLIAAPIYAADTPAVKVDGFVDSVLSGSSLIDSDPEDSESNTAFSYAAKVGLSAAITEKVAAKVDLFIDGNTDALAGAGQDNIVVKQAYGSWVVGDGLTLKTGKFISDYGFVATYAPELYRVNQGPIVALYGGDQIGANLAYAKDALTVAFTVANGLFDEGEQYNNGAQSANGQKDQAMFVGVDVAYDLSGKGSVNFELGYDMDANPTGGDGIYAGVNAKFSPNEQLTVAGELVYASLGTVDDAPATDDDETAIGFMAMANYKLGTALPFDSSITGMIQYVTADGVDNVKDDTVDILEVSVALLTTPAGTKNLNANVEIFYQSTEAEIATVESEASTMGAAVELLYVF